MRRVIAYLLFLVLLTACRKDFIVEDISGKSITVNAPANNTATTINLVTFWWDELDGAEKYTLQIVKPDFAKAAQLLLDTNVVSNKFNFSLQPGSYQWRIRATNAGHSTDFQVFNLRIDTTSNLSQQLVNLSSPVNGATTGKATVTFNWSNLASATKYRFQINNGLELDTTFSSRTSFVYTFHPAANSVTTYSWNVKAINAFSESQYNATPFLITIDLKGPSAPVLSSPIGSGTVAATDSLKWKRASDALYDSVFVSLDSLFANFQQIRAGDAAIPVSEFQLPSTPFGSYYWWKVRSFDAYGNASAYSLRQKFRIP